MDAMPSCLGMLSQGNETRCLGILSLQCQWTRSICNAGWAIFLDLHIDTCVPGAAWVLCYPATQTPYIRVVVV